MLPSSMVVLSIFHECYFQKLFLDELHAPVLRLPLFRGVVCDRGGLSIPDGGQTFLVDAEFD